MIWDKANEGSQALCADNNFVRFLKRNYFHVPDRSKLTFLDIGPGKHQPNTVWLENRGFTQVTTLDISHSVRANHHGDIRTFDLFGPETFDLILDINTLCHVENPPFKKIKSWLKPGGQFFSVAPRDDTWRGHLEGKGYCRCADLKTVCELYSDFAPLEIGWSAYTQNGHEITSWIIEGGKCS